MLLTTFYKLEMFLLSKILGLWTLRFLGLVCWVGNLGAGWLKMGKLLWKGLVRVRVCVW